LSDGVTGNTSDFGSEESRFETWSDNKKRLTMCDSRVKRMKHIVNFVNRPFEMLGVGL
jgi:hypothetical protein